MPKSTSRKGRKVVRVGFELDFDLYMALCRLSIEARRTFTAQMNRTLSKALGATK